MSRRPYTEIMDSLNKTEKALNLSIKALYSASTVSAEAKEALNEVIKIIGLPTDRKTLQEAKCQAQDFIEQFTPFTFKDLGIRWNQSARKKFLEWAEENSIHISRERCSGANGYQYVFYPYKLQGGFKIIAPPSKREKGKGDIPVIEITEGPKPWSQCSGDGCEHPSHEGKGE